MKDYIFTFSVMVTLRSLLAGSVAALMLAAQFSAMPLGLETAHAQTSQVTVTQSATPTVHAGSLLQYSVIVRNNGTTAVDGQLINYADTVLSYATFQPSQSNSSNFPGVTCSRGTTGPVTCSSVSIAPGAVAAFLLTYLVNSNVPCSGSIQNTVGFQTTGSSQPINANPSSTAFQCPDTADLKIEMTGPSTVPQGGVVVYKLSAIWVAGTTATNVSVQDPIPDGVAFNPAQSDSACRQEQNIIICTTPSLSQAQGRRDFNVAFTVPQSASCNSIISNTAAICKTDQEDMNPDNDTFNSTIQTTVLCNQSQQLTVTKTDNRTTVQPGETLTYTITLQNNGSQAATNISVLDTLPTTLTFVSASDNAIRNGQAISWNGLTVPAYGSKTLTLTATVNQGIANGTVISNNATVTGQNVSGTDTTTVSGGGNQGLTVIKNDNRTTVRTGETLTYTITIQNNSSQTVSNITATDALPYGLTYISSSDNGYLNGQTVTWSNLTISAYSSKTLTLTALVNQNLSNGTVITNTATVTGGGTSGTDTTTVDGGNNNNSDQFRVRITDTPDPVRTGDILTYTINLESTTCSTQNVNMTQILPSDVIFLSASENAYESNGIVRWNSLSLGCNQTKVFTVTTRVRSGVSQNATLRTTVNAGSASDEETTRVDGGSNNRPECDDGIDNDNDGRIDASDLDCSSPDDDDEGNGNNQANLSVIKTADRSEAHAGEQVSYSITVRNLGTSTVQNITVDDSYPAHQMTITDAGMGTLTNGRIRWTISSLGAGEVRTITYRAQLAWNLTGGTSVQNNVTVTSTSGGSTVGVSTIQIPYQMPQTGANDFVSPLENTATFLRPVGADGGSNALAIVLSSIGLMGTIGGAIARRKFLS